MAQDSETAQQIEELRRVLLKPEALVDRITPLIAEILTEKISESGDEIADAIAPVIGEALRRQVYQAREDIIDALYPVVGQMIGRAVAESIRGLAQTIDNRMRQRAQVLTDPRYWRARLRGVGGGEYELREALPFTIREIFLIQRESGLLICHYSGDKVRVDRDLVSGMLTAIRDFAREALDRSESGELGAIAYESQQILIEAGGAAYLAVVIEGVEPSDFRATMRQTLISIHEKRYDQLRHFDGSHPELVETILGILRKRLIPPDEVTVQRQNNTSTRIIIGVLIALMLLPMIICVGWIWRVESNMSMLLAPTASPTSTALPTAGFVA